MTTSPSRAGAEFIALMALTFSLIAMSIDSMLPALGDIARDLGAGNPNDRQFVLTAFFAGLTLGQFIYGPISDSTGRKPAMYAGFGCFIVGGLICALTTDFSVMIMGRVLQGFGAAGPRIVGTAMVRDLYAGRAMAQVMSFVMAVFIMVPILAPSIGQLILLVADWRGIFFGLVLVGAINFFWLAMRRAETLEPTARAPLSLGHILRSAREALGNRITLGYTIATGFIFGAFISYLGMSQQIFQDQYAAGKLFAVYFGVLAAGIGCASITNATLVTRFGMRTLSKLALRAACLWSLGFLVIAFLLGGHPPLWFFLVFMVVLFFCNGLLFGNYNALAMEPMGHIAGVAAAVIGAGSSLIAVVAGTLIGRLYDGTVIPLVAGFTAMEIAAFLVTEWAERGRSKRVITPS
ncbi:multidrug effflux MFS transporter [Taklimakanibacter albus]|uniref:Multidrug effflux MFS transporter n=1 Tax=Taklimakanibacter albus TaxID=2800327 RepID=A0ACC5R4E6_9HYPH|nr:multidrug effflux MFS transporter [Aestuariivirga sp. YIM B02566]MBK1867452.1 multidrug effflux MFS transporter [Aestuariivirga sp. YIM B02566]